MEVLRLYTIKDLKDWVMNGIAKDGLSEAVITPTRAYSIIHNPYVTDDMPAVSALFVNNKLAAFTAAFPERLAKPDCMTHWINSLYVSPKYEGKGYALFVISSLIECFEGDPVFDLDAMDTSVEIFKYMRIGATTFTRYCFREKSISRSSLKGRVAFMLEERRHHRRHRTAAAATSNLRPPTSDLSLAYDNFIDKEAYNFMVSHSDGDMFLRRQESLNWMLHYPFVHEAPLLKQSSNQAIRQLNNLFSSSKPSQRYYVAKLFIADKLAAVYILRNSSTGLSLDYLYYDDQHERTVFLSIIEHILHLRNGRFSTTHPRLAEIVRQLGVFPIHYEEAPSLCYSKEYEHQICLHIQGGDGDIFLS